MPDIIFWPLFVTFAGIAIATTIKAVEATHAKKLADDECTRLRAQLEVLNNPVNKGTIEVQAHSAVKKKEPLKLQNETLHDERLEEIKEKILALVAQNERSHDAEIAKLAGASKQLTTLHLQDLKTENLVRSSFGLDENMYRVDIWFIEQPGRKYLLQHGLL
jgi:hypothetical protein